MDQTINNLLTITYKSLVGPGIKPDTNHANDAKAVENIISTIIGILTIVAVILFVFQIIFAGYSFLSAQGDEKKVESARKRLTDGILGLAIVVFAYGMGALVAGLFGLENVFDLTKFLNFPNG